jgi:CRP/FNR family transcriptional regulator, anaerobic regulatory protein
MDAIVNSAVRIHRLAPALYECPYCAFSAWALSAHITPAESKRFHDGIVHNRRVKRHEFVHRAGGELATLNVVNSGFLKTSIMGRDGHVQVTGFSMRGDMVGLDAIATGIHQCDTIALEDAYLCGIEFADFEHVARDIPALQHQFNKAMGAEIARDHDVMLLLGAMRAEERVAIFLLNLSKRLATRRGSAVQFRLPMQRQEIGNYLGLKLETISRALSHLQASGLIAIDGKDIEIKSIARLQQSTKV